MITGKHTTRFFETDHTAYGGRIYLSDFETDYECTMAYMAARIVNDHLFDERCKKAAGQRDQRKEFCNRNNGGI
ncbi:MAG: hypothetical protein ACI39R_06900 [Lachnospiraceae bacterium]